MRRILERLESGRPLRTTELADLGGFSSEYVRKLAAAGVIEARRVGRCWSIPVREAEKILRDVGALLE